LLFLFDMTIHRQVNWRHDIYPTQFQIEFVVTMGGVLFNWKSNANV
jgi:hypothetical protein